MFFEKFAKHYKPTVSGYTETYQYVADFKINVQPSNGESTVLVGGVYGRTFTAFTAYTGLNINDQVTISGMSTPYRVKAVQSYDYAPLPHVEAVLVLPEV